MSALGEVAPGSFDGYEGIRIVIPGLIVYATAVGTFETLAPSEPLGQFAEPAVGFVSALAVGLFLYFWDVPARAAAYTENQPTEYLEAKYPHVKPAELLTAYFLALNTKMPANTRNRSLYMGSMYRIGVEMILALGLATTVTFTASLFAYGRPDVLDGHRARVIAGAVLAAAYVLGLIVNHGYERRTAERSRAAMTRLGRSVQFDLFRRATIIYATGALLVLLPGLTWWINRTHAHYRHLTPALGLAICFGYWAYTYVRGVPDPVEGSRRRRRLHSTTSGALLAWPLFATLIAYDPGPSNILGSVSRLVAWTAVASLATFSVVVRGHERKLHGVYRGQTRWLEENPTAMDDVLPSHPNGA